MTCQISAKAGGEEGLPGNEKEKQLISKSEASNSQKFLGVKIQDKDRNAISRSHSDENHKQNMCGTIG